MKYYIHTFNPRHKWALVDTKVEFTGRWRITKFTDSFTMALEVTYTAGKDVSKFYSLYTKYEEYTVTKWVSDTDLFCVEEPVITTNDCRENK